MKAASLAPRTLPPNDQTHRSKRDMLLDAAAAVFCQEGFAGASIDAVAVKAGVSRQTVYNQIGDKEKLFKAVVEEITMRSGANFFQLLETFPDQPHDLEAELTDFCFRLLRNHNCDPNSRWLLRLIEYEGARYPELFSVWREYGQGHKYPAIAARLARLAHAGYLKLDDPTLAARQLMSLLTAEFRSDLQMGITPSDADIRRMSENAVRTFLLAFGTRRTA